MDNGGAGFVYSRRNRSVISLAPVAAAVGADERAAVRPFASPPPPPPSRSRDSWRADWKRVCASQPSLAPYELLASPPQESGLRTAGVPLYRRMQTASLARNGDMDARNNNSLDSPSLFDGVAPLSSTPIRNGIDSETLVFNNDGALIAGTVEALISKLIPTKNYCPDRSYTFTVLLNLRIFIPPADVLHEILQHCMFEQNSAAENFKKELRVRFFLNIMRLCKEWTENFPYDFRDEIMLERLTELLSLCSADRNSQQHSATLLQNLQATLAKVERYESALADIRSELSHQLWPSESFTGLASINKSALTVAHQLTHIELERLSMMGPEEIIYALASEYIDTTNVLQKGIRRTRNHDHYVEWFNRLSVLTSTEICRHLKKRHRVRIIEFLIDVAKECFNIGNFNSLMAIVAGLTSTAVVRLKKTWAKVDSSKLRVLQRQLDPSANFASYRATLKAAIWRDESATNPSEKIIIPCFSLLVKDMLFLHQKCVRRLPNGLLNFALFHQLALQMREVVRWKRADCPFERHPALLQYLLTSAAFSEKALLLASFECEHPDQSSDKETHKRYKMELQWSR